MLCSILCFCLLFELHFLIHLTPLMHHLLPLFISSFLSLLPLDSFVYSWQEGGKYTRKYTGVYCHFYMTHVHILRERNSTSCAFVGGENHRRDAYTKGEKTFLWENLVLFCFTLCLFSRYFMVRGVTFNIYGLLLSSHCVCVLDMHLSWCHCALLVACSDDHLHCYMIIVVIFIWLFGVWSSCSHVSYHVYLIAILVLLSLDLPWGSNAFCASFSSYKYICSKFITASKFRCEWVLPLFPNSLLNIESVIWCFAPELGGDCKVAIYNYVLCWLYSMTKSVVIALILFLVFCGILLY